MNPTVSILVPVFQVEKYIERCARSLFEQTYDNIEYIFVDDCSPDNSIAELKQVLSTYPNRKEHTKIIKHHKNRGLAAARNTGIENATGDFVMHVDSDDWLDIYTVEECIKEIERTKADIVYFDIISHWAGYDDIMSIPPDIEREKLLFDMLSMKYRHCLCGACYRRSLYSENCVNAIEGVNMAEDFQVAPILLYYSKVISCINSNFYHYDRTTEISYTSFFSEDKIEQQWISINYVSSFFQENASEYLSALNIYKLNTSFQDIKNCCLSGGHSQYFRKTILNRLKIVDRTYWNYIPFLRRVVFYLDNEFLIKVYLVILIHFNIFIKKIACSKIIESFHVR